MTKAFIKTHRCAGSLIARTPIRYAGEDFDRAPAWRLYEVVDDWEYDAVYLRRVTEIQYCPFCGTELRADDA